MIVVISRRKAVIGLLVVFHLVLALMLGGVLWPGPTQKAITTLVNANRLVPIYCVETAEKKIAISFDAAWGADKTDELLRILADYDVKTTFFLVGFWLQNHADVARRIAEAGHEIGNHSATHPHMNSLTAEQIRFELQSTHQLIKEITGQDANLFRPPFGEYNNRLIQTCESIDYLTIQWSIDSHDWMNVSTDYIVDRVTSRIKPGAIVLFHNNAEKTPEALPAILDYCREQGYEVVPISELLIKGDYYIDKSNGMMRPR